MKSIRGLLLGAFAILVVVVSGPVSVLAGGGESPEAVVATFQNSLVNVMKVADSLTVAQRFKKLEPTLDMAFHFQIMTQIAVGAHWSTTDHASRLKATQSFRRLSISTLATLFDGYSGEFFEHQSNMPGPSKTILVTTDLVKSDKKRIEIVYVTRKFKDVWRIIDVVLDGGISELKVKQSEYHQILKNEGVIGLIDLLDNKSNELLNVKTPQ
jgi:phospholipid transport system substrate-binding protein